MKLIAAIVSGVFAVTFAWGALVHVMEEGWSWPEYIAYYCKEVGENFEFAGEVITKKVSSAQIKRPEFNMNIDEDRG